MLGLRLQGRAHERTGVNAHTATAPRNVPFPRTPPPRIRLHPLHDLLAVVVERDLLLGNRNRAAELHHVRHGATDGSGCCVARTSPQGYRPDDHGLPLRFQSEEDVLQRGERVAGMDARRRARGAGLLAASQRRTGAGANEGAGLGQRTEVTALDGFLDRLAIEEPVFDGDGDGHRRSLSKRGRKACKASRVSGAPSERRR